MSDSPIDTHTIVVTQRWTFGWLDCLRLALGYEIVVTAEVKTYVTYREYPNSILDASAVSIEVVKGTST